MKIIIMDNYEKKILSGEEVIEEFDKIAVWHCQRYGVQGYDKEDIYQSCLLEIYQAYIEYDYTKEIKFSTFANSFVKNMLKRLIRDCNTQKRANRQGNDVSLDKQYDDSGISLLDTLCYNENMENKITSKIIYEQIINSITEDEMKLIPVLMGKKSMQKLGDELGISKVAIHKRTVKFKNKIRNEYIIIE